MTDDSSISEDISSDSQIDEKTEDSQLPSQSGESENPSTQCIKPSIPADTKQKKIVNPVDSNKPTTSESSSKSVFISIDRDAEIQVS